MSLAIDDFLNQIKGTFKFNERPLSLPPDLRPVYRLSLLTLMLYVCGRANSASLLKLNVINWWLQDPVAGSHAKEIVEGNADLASADIRFEPAFARAIDFANAEGLTSLSKGKKLSLTDKGIDLAKELVANGSLERELHFLNAIGKKLTEQSLNSMKVREP